MSRSIQEVTEKLKRRIAIDEEEMLRGTIRFGRPRKPVEEERAPANRWELPASFDVPVPDTRRPSKNGKRSFHFNLSYVSKTRARKPGSKKVEIVLAESGGPKAVFTDAAEHDSYITREDAVMTISAAAYETYMGRSASDEEMPLILSNISPSSSVRHGFWKEIVPNERDPGPDQLTMYPALLTAGQWEDCFKLFQGRPRLKSLLRVIAAGPSDEPWTLELERGDCGALLPWLKAVRNARSGPPAAVLRTGRGGRVQWRIVAELPEEIDDAGRIRIAQRFAKYLDGLGVMYTLAVHRPDYANDKRNHHIHVVFYDRKAEWLPEHDCWDFAYRERAPSGHKGRTRASKRQKKNGLTRPLEPGQNHRTSGSHFVKQLRETYAGICNGEFENAGMGGFAGARFFAGSYEELGIDQEPQEHLGSRLSALEKVGIATVPGIQNAERSWQGLWNRRTGRALTSQQTRTETCRKHDHRTEAMVRELTRIDSQTGVAGALTRATQDMHAEAAAIGSLELDGVQFLMTFEMAISRALKTREYCDRLLAAIDAGTAGKKEMKHEGLIRARRDQANQHCLKLYREFGADYRAVVKTFEEIAETDGRISELEGRIAVLMGEARQELEAVKQARSRLDREADRLREQSAAYEASWERVLTRISEQGPVVMPPNEKTPEYHVPGIQKEDLDILLNPILKRRTQARLKGIHELQEKQRQVVRSRDRQADVSKPVSAPDQGRVPGPMAIPSPVAEQAKASTPAPDAAQEQYARLAREALQKAKADRRARAKPIIDGFLERREALPLKYDQKQVLSLDLARIDEADRSFAEALPGYVRAACLPHVRAIRAEVARAARLAPHKFARPASVRIDAVSPIYRPTLSILVQHDPVIARAIAIGRRNLEREVAAEERRSKAMNRGVVPPQQTSASRAQGAADLSRLNEPKVARGKSAEASTPSSQDVSPTPALSPSQLLRAARQGGHGR